MSSRFPLEPDAAQMRQLVEAALERIVAHLESLPEQPATNTDGAIQEALRLVEPLPEDGTPLEELLEFLFEEAAPRSFNTAGPGYLAYIPGGGLFHAAVADLIADTVNRYTGVAAAAPILSQLEANVLRWFASIVGFPPSARGILTSGGSLAMLSGIVTAREARLGGELAEGTVYVSDQIHHSVAKACVLAGLPPANVRQIPTDSRFRIQLEAVREAIRVDRTAGRRPFLLVGSAGTVNTGAVDDLGALAELARAEDLWFHVDGAYGGFFALTEEGQRVLSGIDGADSIVLDPHKGLFLPYGTGALLVRDGDALARAHSSAGDYLPPFQDERELWDFCQLSPELSKPFRGLRIWLPFRLLGAAPFRDALAEKLELARFAAGEIRDTEGLELVGEPELSLFAFRLAGSERLPVEEANRRNRELLERINAPRRVFLTGTLLEGRFALRICILSFRTHRDRIRQGIQDIRTAVREMGTTRSGRG